MKPVLVPMERVDEVWPHVATDISKCLIDTNADCCAADLFILCRQGAAFLLVIMDGEVITAATVWRPETWPSAIVLKNLVTVGHNMPKWRAVAREAAFNIARMCGATKLRWQGRAEWARVFRNARIVAMTFEVDVI